MTAEKKKYEFVRIIALDGSTIYRSKGLTALKNGKTNAHTFSGVLDDSLETIKLREIYAEHEAEIGYPYLEDKAFCRAIVSVSFDYAIKQYEKQGRRYVLYGQTVTDEEMVDHVCIRTIDGKTTLMAIETPLNQDRHYAPVEQPISAELLGKYFVYDAEKHEYKRSDKEMPSVVKKEKIREHLYLHGFDIDGIHYVRYKRSAGSSRDGRCLFIAEPLYKDMMAWSACGLYADTVSDQASWQAYIALTLSSIESTIRLPKKAILIIPDKVSKFKTTAVCVKEDKTLGLTAVEEETEIENVIWDGEALLDVSEFERAGYKDKGMMLLRNRFFKTCAFNTNLQKWFKDNGITTVGQLAGYTTARKVEDIKLVITESSLKYLKFMPKGQSLKVSLEAWLDAVYGGKTTSEFGVVKTDKPPSNMEGRLAYTNYQLMNTLAITPSGMEQLLDASLYHLYKIYASAMHLRYQINYLSETEPDDLAVMTADNYRRKVVMEMLFRTPDFEHTEFYKDLKTDVCYYFKRRLKKGRVLVNGNNQTIFGNPYEFLCAVTDKNYEPTESLLLGDGEVYTKRFEDGEMLTCARNPHITLGNILIGVNRRKEEIDTYFNLTRDIVCANAINSNLQQRLNGCDYDSDTMLVTNDQFLYLSAKTCYENMGVPVCCVAPVGKAEYSSSAVDLARLDLTIAENKIGDIVNLSQFLNSLLWHNVNDGASINDILHRLKLSSFQVILLGFAAVILIGAFLLMLPISSKDGVVTPFSDALFTSTSAVCVTGLIVQDTATYWSYFGQAVILILIQIGGLGVVTVAASVSILAGRKIGLGQRSTMQEAMSAPSVGGIVRLTWFILKGVLIVEAFGMLAMLPVFCIDHGAKGIWMAVFHSISAFCNAGFDVMGEVSGQYSSLTAYASHPVISIVIMLLIIIGGIGFLTWEDIYRHKWHVKKYRTQSKIILAMTGALIFIPTLYFFFCEFEGYALGERILLSLFQAVTPRTAGFNTANLGLISEVGLIFMIFLMLVGGSPGSTAGGMKTTTLAVLFASATSVFRKKENAQMFKRRIADDTVKHASAICLLYIVLFLLGGTVISAVEGLPLMTCLYETASAIGTVGLSLGITPSLGTVSRIILIALMFFGRVGGLTLIYATFGGTKKNISKLPMDKVTVG